MPFLRCLSDTYTSLDPLSIMQLFNVDSSQWTANSLRQIFLTLWNESNPFVKIDPPPCVLQNIFLSLWKLSWKMPHFCVASSREAFILCVWQPLHGATLRFTHYYFPDWEDKMNFNRKRKVKSKQNTSTRSRKCFTCNFFYRKSKGLG